MQSARGDVLFRKLTRAAVLQVRAKCTRDTRDIVLPGGAHGPSTSDASPAGQHRSGRCTVVVFAAA